MDTPVRGRIEQHHAPTVVVEVRSPDDETYDKLAWYAGIGVPEVWIVDRDTRRPEIHALTPEGYVQVAPDPRGVITSPLLGIRLQSCDGLLAMQAGDDPSSRQLLPIDGVRKARSACPRRDDSVVVAALCPFERPRCRILFGFRC